MKKAFSWIERKCIQTMLKQPKNTMGIRIVQGNQNSVNKTNHYSNQTLTHI